jgi:uncharacterized membrane protein YdjX (TVP38/TMEM64 family)
MAYWMKWAVVVVLAIGLGILVWRVDLQPILLPVLQMIDQFGFWAPVAFILFFTVATVFFMPGSILSMGAGAMFGLFQGSIIAWLGAVSGATAAFLVGRYLARQWVERKIKGHPKYIAIDKAVGEEGWKIVLLTRLAPIFPFKLLNYAFGLTRVSFSGYFTASAGGILPGTVVHVYLGTIIRWGVEDRERTAAEWGSYALGFAAILGVAIYFSWFARKKLKERIPEEEAAQGR